MSLNSICVYIASNPMLAIFLSVGIGFAIGKIKIGKFTPGGVAGTLLVAVAIGQLGFEIPSILSSVFFGLFVYACGYKGGPNFFGALNKKSIKFVISAIVMTISGLVCVIISAKLFNLDSGLAAGLAAGAMTQSAILGTAGDAISKLGIEKNLIKDLQTNIAVGYSVTYIFGSLGPILMTGTIFPLIMKWDLRKAASDLALSQNKGSVVLEKDEVLATQKIDTRIYKVGEKSKYIGEKITTLEIDSIRWLFVLDIYRNEKKINFSDLEDYKFEVGDIVVLGGKVSSLILMEEELGREISDDDNKIKTVEKKESIFITNKKLDGKSIEVLKHLGAAKGFRGFVISSILRDGKLVELDRKVILKVGDEITLLGRKIEIERIIKKIGYPVPDKNIVNIVTLCAGVSIGIYIGHLTFSIFGIPVSLGTGGGCLLAGLIFGWLKSKKPKLGGIDSGTVNFLQSFGLVLFVSIVGLNAGKDAITAVKTHGMTLFWLGAFVTLVPQIVTFIVNYFILKIKNPVEAVSIIAGGKSSNPALSEVLSKTGNSTPILPFTIGYAVANILLTMWGPIIVALIGN